MQQLLQCGIHLYCISSINRDRLEVQLLCSNFCISLFDIDIGIAGIHQQCNPRNVWGNFPEELDTLRSEDILVEKDASHVPAGAVYAFDESKADGITANSEHDRH